MPLSHKGSFEKGEREEAERAFASNPKLRSFGFGGGKTRGEVTRSSPKSKALEKAKGLKEAEHRGNAMRMRKHEEMKKRYPHLIKP